MPSTKLAVKMDKPKMKQLKSAASGPLEHQVVSTWDALNVKQGVSSECLGHWTELLWFLR